MTLNKAITAILISIASVFGVLAFGNPQWGSFFYKFQAYTFPAYAEDFDLEMKYDWTQLTSGPVPIPVFFTGNWKAWHKDGILMYDVNIRRWNEDYPMTGESISYFVEGTNEIIVEQFGAFDGENRERHIRKRYTRDMNLIEITARLLELDPETDRFTKLVILSEDGSVDRRAEFGIEVE